MTSSVNNYDDWSDPESDGKSTLSDHKIDNDNCILNDDYNDDDSADPFFDYETGILTENEQFNRYEADGALNESNTDSTNESIDPLLEYERNRILKKQASNKSINKMNINDDNSNSDNDIKTENNDINNINNKNSSGGITIVISNDFDDNKVNYSDTNSDNENDFPHKSKKSIDLALKNMDKKIYSNFNTIKTPSKSVSISSKLLSVTNSITPSAFSPNTGRVNPIVNPGIFNEPEYDDFDSICDALIVGSVIDSPSSKNIISIKSGDSNDKRTPKSIKKVNSNNNVDKILDKIKQKTSFINNIFKKKKDKQRSQSLNHVDSMLIESNNNNDNNNLIIINDEQKNDNKLSKYKRKINRFKKVRSVSLNNNEFILRQNSDNINELRLNETEMKDFGEHITSKNSVQLFRNPLNNSRNNISNRNNNNTKHKRNRSDLINKIYSESIKINIGSESDSKDDELNSQNNNNNNSNNSIRNNFTNNILNGIKKQTKTLISKTKYRNAIKSPSHQIYSRSFDVPSNITKQEFRSMMTTGTNAPPPPPPPTKEIFKLTKQKSHPMPSRPKPIDESVTNKTDITDEIIESTTHTSTPTSNNSNENKSRKHKRKHKKKRKKKHKRSKSRNNNNETKRSVSADFDVDDNISQASTLSTLTIVSKHSVSSSISQLTTQTDTKQLRKRKKHHKKSSKKDKKSKDKDKDSHSSKKKRKKDKKKRKKDKIKRDKKKKNSVKQTDWDKFVELQKEQMKIYEIQQISKQTIIMKGNDGINLGVNMNINKMGDTMSMNKSSVINKNI